MIVADSRISFAVAHQKQETTHTFERLELRFSEPGVAPQRRVMPDAPETGPDLSRAGSLLRLERQSLDFTVPLSSDDQLQILLLKELYYRLTGRRLRLNAPEFDAGPVTATLEMPIAVAPNAAEAGGQGFGMLYERHQVYRDSESLSFRAEGEVTTADGRVLDIAAALNMSREYIERTSFSVRAGDAALIDPLVINFDGRGARLSDERFEFDLDANGEAEQIAALAPGSGYLALDRDGDGRIGNGKELFGPQSGNGFTELAEFDEDGNGFIDEADAIYRQLRIWRRFEDGSQQLIALGDAGVGAIYLGHVSSPFTLKGAGNETLGEVASSSVYLREDGTTGLVQQVNLAV